ncbi:MAG: transporter substrate-binding domain-containing protein [Acidimicrobiia bacterium]|nr:transporter substrate-binding domain-containing protein [Acidimicrobiia bacterium]
MRTRFLRLLAALLAFTLFAAACGDDGGTDTDTDTATGDGTGAADATGDDQACEPTDELPDLDGREVSVAVENAYLPFNYIDAETGEPAGWDYAAIDHMAELLNFEPVYETFAWEPMIQAVADGQFDMAADGITINDERAEVVDFSDGYINIEQRLLVGVGEDRFADADELANDDSLTIGSQTGTTNYDTAVDLVGEERVQAFEQFGFAVQALIAGDVDAVIMDESAGQGYVGENADDVELTGPSLSSDELGFIFPPGSDLVCPINLAIADMKADGTMEALGEEYFSGAFTITDDDIAEVDAVGADPVEEEPEADPAGDDTEG